MEGIIKQIYDLSVNSKIVHKYNKSTALYMLNNSYDKKMTDLVINKFREGNLSEVEYLQSKIRHSYRTLIKVIFENCQDGQLNKNIENADFKLFSDELDRLIEFNHMRNIIERYNLGYFVIKEETTDSVTLSRSKDFRDPKYDFYNRLMQMSDDKTSNKDNNIVKKKCFETINPNVLKNYKRKGYFHTYDNFFNLTYGVAYDSVLNEADIKDDYRFDKFSLEEYRKVYAYILARSLNRGAFYQVSKLTMRQIPDMEYCPSFEMQFNELIDTIANYVSIDNDKVENIINCLIFDYNLHKNKLSIYQPLFRIDDTILFSVWLVNWELAQNKFLYVMAKKNENQAILSKIALDKERIMIEDVIKEIKQFAWMYKKNATLKLNREIKAEFDLCIYEKETGTILLVELKWLSNIDNEYEAHQQDMKLNDFCIDRKRKGELVLDNIDDFLNQNMQGIKREDIHSIESVIISKNNIGNTKIDEVIPIIDWFIFVYILKDSKGSLKHFIDYIKNGVFLNALESYIKDNEVYEFGNLKMIVDLK